MKTTMNEMSSSEAKLGILEWFPVGERDTVERTLDGMRALGVSRLRTGISWADWHAEGGIEWFEWLMSRLSAEPGLDVLPCFNYTPPSLGLIPMTSAPPREPRLFADFIDTFLARWGEQFEYVELWNEPNNLAEWDYTRDPQWKVFAEMIGGAAFWAKQLGKKVVLGGMSPIDPGWLELMFDRGLMEHIDVIGIHGFPGTWEKNWTSWDEQIQRVREVVERRGGEAEIWITEVGYSTRKHRDFVQAEVFTDVLAAPVERIYWYAMHDLADARPSVVGLHYDERDYHCGLLTETGKPKLLYRLWERGGVSGVQNLVSSWRRSDEPVPGSVLVTGGAGFVGSNVSSRLLEMGRTVVILDDLSRPGVERNLRWLRENHPENLRFVPGDIRDPLMVRHVLRGVTEVYHFAAQVAVTTSLDTPRDDFSVNAGGTLNLLESMRAMEQPPKLLFTSTNKVYGGLYDVEFEELDTRWAPLDEGLQRFGVGEEKGISLCSPYGCSKGAADQYVLDYARTFGLDAVVFRMSCIYGPRQFGTEDQGWVAHFLLRALEGDEITIFGDGKQVRDILYVDDLVDAMLLAQKSIGRLRGEAFNIGGGASNSTSLLELLGQIGELEGRAPAVSWAPWRASDQRYYVSDTRRFKRATGWAPKVSAPEGVARLYEWLAGFNGYTVSKRTRRIAVQAAGE